MTPDLCVVVTALFVTDANAGVQAPHCLRDCDVTTYCAVSRRFWMAAFAGMTTIERLGSQQVIGDQRREREGVWVGKERRQFCSPLRWRIQDLGSHAVFRRGCNHFRRLRRHCQAICQRRIKPEGVFRRGFQAERIRKGAALAFEKPMIAVERAHDFDHPINRPKVRPRHGAVGDEKRFVETAHLERQELGRRLGHAACENFANERAHAFLPHALPRRDLGDGNAAVQKVENPPFPLELRQARRRASIDRSRAAAGGERFKDAVTRSAPLSRRRKNIVSTKKEQTQGNSYLRGCATCRFSAGASGPLHPVREGASSRANGSGQPDALAFVRL